MDRKRDADRVAAELAAAARQATAEAARRTSAEKRETIRAEERRIKALIPRSLERLADLGHPGIEEVEVVRRGVFRERRERLGAYQVAHYEVPESMGGPARTLSIRLLSDGRLFIGHGATYSLEEFTEEVLDSEGLGQKDFVRKMQPFSLMGLRNLAEELGRIASAP